MVVTERIFSWHCKDLALRVSNNFSRLNSPLFEQLRKKRPTTMMNQKSIGWMWLSFGGAL
mgnify:FL=1